MSVHSKKRRLQEIPNKYVNLLTSFERIRICQSSSAQCGHYLFTKKKTRDVYHLQPLVEQGWRSGETARLPPMCPGFNYPLFPSPEKLTFPNSNSICIIVKHVLHHEPLARVIAQALPVFDIKFPFLELLDALESSNSAEFPVLEGKFVFRRKTHKSAEGRAPYFELARLLCCLNWWENRTVISSLTKISLKIILDAKITSVSSDLVNTIYRPIRLQFTLDEGIWSKAILSATSFPFLNMNWAVPFSFLQHFFVVVVTLSFLIKSYCFIFFESAL